MPENRSSSLLSDSPQLRNQAAADATTRGMVREPAGRDACGIGFVADIKGRRSHQIVVDALQVLENLTHRAAVGADPETGDGAGITLHVPHRFFSEELSKQGVELGAPGHYAVGMLFCPRSKALFSAIQGHIAHAFERGGLRIVAWRDVPVDESKCGSDARSVLPAVKQVFVAPLATLARDAFERALYLARRRFEKAIAPLVSSHEETFYVSSLSTQTVIYKGLLLPRQMSAFYVDLADPRVESAIALVHSRFSTNTFPSWERAHPYRYVMHNGEFNTVKGNVNWMRARESSFASEAFGDAIADLLPVIDLHGSDSAMFDNAVELLVQSGRSLPHALMMLVPEAWQQHREMSAAKRGFYEYHACLMEPWDGPAAIGFTDGNVIGALLDRNGLRPARYIVTSDDRVVLSSEVGVLPISADKVVAKGRIEPGKMFLIDTVQGRIVDDVELKEKIATAHPYDEWVFDGIVELDALSLKVAAEDHVCEHGEALLRRHLAQGYSREDVAITLRKMAVSGEEPIGSMGNDAPLALLSSRPQSLFSYFRQTFAQVTNPPIDSLRESLVMSLVTTLGHERNLFETTPDHCRLVRMTQPILTHTAMTALRRLSRPGLRAATIDATYLVEAGAKGLEQGIADLCAAAQEAVANQASIVIISDRAHGKERAPIPALLACSAVHHQLIRAGLRSRCGLVVESGEPREVMHFALLLGFGAAAIYPYVVWDTLENEADNGELDGCDAHGAQAHFIKAVAKGLLKILAKMGISTLQSYRGAQVFEAIGLNSTLIDRYFTWTTSKIEGIGLSEIAAEVLARHRLAYEAPRELVSEIELSGTYQWRRNGELHMYDPQTIGLLQHAARSGDYRVFKKFSARANASEERLYTLRGLLKLKSRGAIPLDEVESLASIVSRFRTGAMSYGSISKEAHENIAIAMNRLGGRSNTGEGGEESERFVPDANGDVRRSAIKQIASGRFGVTSNYLVNADELQIKMAQGAKPGEGGQLPGHKVDAAIARVRHSTPGVGLISPPPHHDIYSIEDLAQLIFDLKNANEDAAISVKLVSEAGVGTVAAGVAKAKADSILISGDCGGTGASPLSSIKHAGTPWELGLAEAHQTLLVNGLRDRVKLETDGHLKTGRDVAIACLLGAELFGFGTAALVASGCIMMRVCHNNTCPVGVATQDPELRKRFKGEPDHVINFMTFVAMELREVMAELGFKTIAEMVGRVECIEAIAASEHLKASGLSLAPLLHQPTQGLGENLGCTRSQHHELAEILDRKLVQLAAPALERGEPVSIRTAIGNVDRTTCTLLSSEVSRRFGEDGLPQGTISIAVDGSAGQSFAAFLASGIDVRLVGEANDYVGKGLSGGRIVIVPPARAAFVAEEQVILGNVALYGATKGELYARGRAGERFAVRNSGATAVVEGVGDHGCEYMTGGTVVVLGRTGRNFGAGMSGGVAYVWDESADFRRRCNQTMVHLEHLDARDEDNVHALISRHLEQTGSDVAARILRDWYRSRGQFWKVISPEYKRVLLNREKKVRARETVHLVTI
jgi:glutamate synthase (ferredoxin)